MIREKRTAITRTQTIILVVVLVLAVVAGEVALGNANKSSGGPVGVDLHIIEDNPALQIDHFYPDTIYVPLNESISLAIQNGDDETRVFTLSQYNINVTIVSGTTERVTLRTSQLGNFSFISPIAPPSAASGNLKAPCLEGFFEVTQNATLLTKTTTPPPAPSEAQVTAAAAGPVGSCTAHPLTVPSSP